MFPVVPGIGPQRPPAYVVCDCPDHEGCEQQGENIIHQPRRSPAMLPGNWVPQQKYTQKTAPQPLIELDPRHTVIKIIGAVPDVHCDWCVEWPAGFAKLRIELYYGGTGKLRVARNFCPPCAEEWLYYWPGLGFEPLAPTGRNWPVNSEEPMYKWPTGM